VGITKSWRSGRRIHVETVIRAELDRVWLLSQTPELHAQWDIRFTAIHPERSPEAGQPSRFVYRRRLAPGLTIRGWGETLATRHRPDGTATSALRFGSNDPRSLIRSGSGYWQYVPMPQGVRFLTAYDYEVRWGVLGRWLDRLVFRATMRWATARSFERLRRWAETGIQP
jgi:hypothetical protein